jgi:hypothetical protein
LPRAGLDNAPIPRAKLGGMTTREKAHKLLDELPESEIEPVVEFIVLRGGSGPNPKATGPEDIIDAWGNLSAMKRASTSGLMRRLAEEEAAAGCDPW